jgi:DNA-binding HxlR family transcriptional regulator
MRAGDLGLSLLADPLNARILITLRDDSLELPDLHHAVGAPPFTTLRGRLKTLAELGLLTRTVQEGFAGSVDLELTQSGRGLIGVARVLAGWLDVSPDGPVPLGGAEAKTRIKALVGGWEASVLRALGARPLSLTELDRVIGGVNYPALERRIVAMRRVGQVTRAPGLGNAARYLPTRWMREAAAPILASLDWERRSAIDHAEPAHRVDAEGILMLAAPLVNLTKPENATFRLVMDLGCPGAPQTAGVIVCLVPGGNTACRSDRHAAAPNSVSGSVAAWAGVFGLGHERSVELAGDPTLGEAFIAGLNRAFAAVAAQTVDGDDFLSPESTRARRSVGGDLQPDQRRSA